MSEQPRNEKISHKETIGSYEPRTPTQMNDVFEANLGKLYRMDGDWWQEDIKNTSEIHLFHPVYRDSSPNSSWSNPFETDQHFAQIARTHHHLTCNCI